MKILVCILGEIRYSHLTWLHFKKHVIDELGADFVTCGPSSKNENEFTKNAIQNIHSESIQDPKFKHNAMAVVYHRRKLWENVPKDYDQYILTRSDHMWIGPHPHLDNDHVWFMNCEFHLGISDRHTVVPRRYLKHVTEGLGFYIETKHPQFNTDHISNIEFFLFRMLMKNGIWGPLTALAPFPMFLTGPRLEYRREDELKTSNEYFYWPFDIDHTYFISSPDVYCGRAYRRESMYKVERISAVISS